MKIIAITQKGPDKTENEDRILVGATVVASGTVVTELTQGILAVADGVGGNPGGAVASGYVAQILSGLSDLSVESLQGVNEGLLEKARQQPLYTNMATTLTGLEVGEKGIRLFHVGNSRAYRLQGGKYWKQLTVDDTTWQYLLSTGQVRLEDGANFSRKNEITACCGGGRAELFRIKLSDLGPLTSPVLLTTDGVHDYLTQDEMEDILQEYGCSPAACEAMVAAARVHGSRDDATVLLGWPK